MSVPPLPHVLLAALVALALAAPAAAAAPAPPPGWPTTLSVGLDDREDGARALAARRAGVTFRYHYLSGGVNTGRGWTSYAEGNGSFVPRYIRDSVRHGFRPVFSYYQLYQSEPAGGQGDESAGFRRNLANTGTMRRYYADLRLFFERAASTGVSTVLHVEPDLWGYLQAAHGDRASDSRAAVASTGLADLRGLPDDASGFARAIVRLRDRYAPRVQLAYHLSEFGVEKNLAHSNEPDAAVDALAHRAATFYRSLRADFDLVFAEFANQDAGRVDPTRRSVHWWDAADFRRHARWLAAVGRGTNRRTVLWQIPLGNTLMRAMDNSPGHFQDNRVQRLLDRGSEYEVLRRYRDAGVIGLLFGSGFSDGTCACDRRDDGVTNPRPIGGNRRRSLNADDDGGLFMERARLYAADGRLSLAIAPPLRIRIAAPGRVRRGRRLAVTATVTSPVAAERVVRLELRSPAGGRIRRVIGRPALAAGRPEILTAGVRLPRRARAGRWRLAVSVLATDGEVLGRNVRRFAVR